MSEDIHQGARSALHRASRSIIGFLDGFRRRVRALLDEAIEGERSRARARDIVIACTVLFLLAFGARLLYLQDHEHAVEFAHEYLFSQPRHYQGAARRILEQGTAAFFEDVYNPRGGARMLLHPPGYAMFVAAAFALLGDSADALRALQLVLDSLAVVLLFLIAVELVPLGAALLAALLAAASPQFASNALTLQPDSVAVLPILGAMLALVHAWRRQSYVLVVLAGVLIGASCWIRSNAFLLALFLAVALVPVLFAEGRRLRAALALALTAYAMIAPITIRNWVVFDSFVPISLGAGITLIEGIADFDPERRFGFPPTDEEVARAEAEWHGRPEYAKGIWSPDGIERDRDRFRRGISVIVENPAWFASVMARRALLMVRYNDDQVRGWPADTSLSPSVAVNPAFGHEPSIPEGSTPVWVRQLGGSVPAVAVRADASSSLISPEISVATGADYLLRIAITPVSGIGHLQIVDEGDWVLASVPVTRRARPEGRVKREGRRGTPLLTQVVLPFATNAVTAVRIKLVGAASGDGEVVAEVGAAELFALGPTPNAWLRGPRTALNALQSTIYGTSFLRGLILAGIALLAIGGRRRALLVLLAVPLYYMGCQSVLHTEYRYILVIHYFFFVAAAVTVYCACALAASYVRALVARASIGGYVDRLCRRQ